MVPDLINAIFRRDISITLAYLRLYVQEGVSILGVPHLILVSVDTAISSIIMLMRVEMCPVMVPGLFGS